MKRRRVVVTGLGVISALGPNTDAFWQALREGRSGISPLENFGPTQFRFQNAAEVHDYTPDAHFGKKQIALLDRFAQLGLVAAREALADAALEWTAQLRQHTAVVTGSAMGGQSTLDKAYLGLYGKQRPRVHPLTVPRAMNSSAASHISMEYGFTGPAYSVSSACSSASHAIGQAFWMVRNGLVDVAVTGGSEAPFGYGNLKAWEALRVIDPDTCRPFSRDRGGTILGEGGAKLVIESLENAQDRGARIYGEIVGFGMSADAHHLTQPLIEGAVRAIRAALEDADLDPQQIGYVNAHGTGTRANDPAETRAIRQVFGEHADHLVISSTKSMHGHTLGAAGALESVATLLALHHGLLPPTANFTEPDPECDLDVVPNEARAASVTYAVSNAFAFGGLNAVLVFRRWMA